MSLKRHDVFGMSYVIKSVLKCNISEGDFAVLSGEKVDPAEQVRYFYLMIEAESAPEM